MSRVTVAVACRDRTTVLRDINADQVDAGGQAPPADWQTHAAAVPCRAWTEVAREPADAGKTYVVEDRKVLVMLGTDVTEADRLGDITRPDGTVLFGGPMNILGVLAYHDHIELAVEAVR